MDWEATGLIGVDLAGGGGDIDNAGVNVVSFGAVGDCWCGGEIVGAGVGFRGSRLGGTEVFSALVLVSHGGGCGFG